MRRAQRTLSITYKIFTVGERVRPSGKNCALPEDGIYTVTEYIPPIGDETTGWVALEGERYRHEAEDFIPADRSQIDE